MLTEIYINDFLNNLISVDTESSKTFHSDPDVILMQKFQNGDEKSFESLMEKYYPLLLNFNYRFLANREKAEDIAQAVFIRVYKNSANYRAKSLFRTWLYRIAKNLCLNEIRKTKIHRQISLESPVKSLDNELKMQFADESLVQPVEEVQNREVQKLIKDAVQTLPVNQRLALIMRAYAGFSYAEIAQTLELTEKAVKSLLSRARMKLKELLEDKI